MNEDLRMQFEEIDRNDPEAVIKFYESNLIYFDNYKLISDTSTMEEFAKIKLAYISSLDTKKRYRKAYKYLRDVDILIQKLGEGEGYKFLKESYFLLFGVIAHRLKKYDESQSYFKILVEIDPENDMYAEWYNANKSLLVSKWTNMVGYLATALLFIDLFLDGIWNMGFGENFYLYAFAVMILSFYFPRLINFINKHRGK